MKSALKNTLWGSGLMVPLLAVLLFGTHLLGVIDFHEADAIDLRFRLRGAQKADPRIVIVAIDDASLAAVGQWPWPRGIYAGFLNIVSAWRPQAVFFDILFPEKSPDPSQDEKFSEALAKAGNTVLSFFYYSEKPFQAAFPVENLKNSARALAYTNTFTEKDGKVRKVKAVLKNEQGVFYAPAFVMTHLDFGSEKEILGKIPLDSKNRAWINFPGDWNAFETVSFRDVIAAAAAQENEKLTKLFEGRLVFVGHTATGTTDIVPTPFSSETPGVLVPASLAHTILSQKYLRKAPGLLDLAVLLLLAAVSALLFKRSNPAKGFLVLLGFSAGYFLLNTLLFVFAGCIFLLYLPLTVLVLSYALTLFMKYTEIHFQREMTDRELATAFRIQEQFLPQELPVSAHLEAAFECRFTKQVGGDLYDWTDLGNGTLGFAAGDVSGKGMPAALYMAKAMSDFRSIQKQNKKPGDVCTRFNQILLTHPTTGMFLTFFYAVLENSGRKLTYASAGHEPSILFRAVTKKAELLSAGQGMPLAMFETEYETVEREVGPGDCLLMYTDGIKELRNPKKEELGTERLRQLFEEIAVSAESPQTLLQKLFERTQDYQQGALPHDDRTLVCIRFKP